MTKKNKSDGIVYSTKPDFKYTVQPNQAASITPGQQKFKVFTDKKNRGGKTVSIVSGFSGKPDELEKLAKEIKSKCGVGGAVKDGEIIIQGDHRDRIVSILIAKGYTAVKV